MYCCASNYFVSYYELLQSMNTEYNIMQFSMYKSVSNII